jgi:hypothetical protein
MTMKTAIPAYAVDLLMAAKYVSWPPKGSTPEMLADGLARLHDAVAAFERAMPVENGDICVEPRQ